MMVDRYTKCVLTVIAACLVWICVMGSGLPVSAQARQRAFTAAHAANVQPVILVGTGTMDSAGAVTVNFVSDRGRDITELTIPVSAAQPLPVSLPYSASRPLPAILSYSPRDPLPIEIASVKKTGEWEPLRAAVEDAPLRRQPGIGRQ